MANALTTCVDRDPCYGIAKKMRSMESWRSAMFLQAAELKKAHRTAGIAEIVRAISPIQLQMSKRISMANSTYAARGDKSGSHWRR